MAWLATRKERDRYARALHQIVIDDWGWPETYAEMVPGIAACALLGINPQDQNGVWLGDVMRQAEEEIRQQNSP